MKEWLQNLPLSVILFFAIIMAGLTGYFIGRLENERKLSAQNVLFHVKYEPMEEELDLCMRHRLILAKARDEYQRQLRICREKED